VRLGGRTCGLTDIFPVSGPVWCAVPGLPVGNKRDGVDDLHALGRFPGVKMLVRVVLVRNAVGDLGQGVRDQRSRVKA
jgi:hypothetical protein